MTMPYAMQYQVGKPFSENIRDAKKSLLTPAKTSSKDTNNCGESIVGDDMRYKKSPVPCRFYASGYCAAENACPFSHVPRGDAPPCKFFAASGGCKFGSKCSMSHATSHYPKANTPSLNPHSAPFMPRSASQMVEDELDMLPTELLDDLMLNDPQEDYDDDYDDKEAKEEENEEEEEEEENEEEEEDMLQTPSGPSFGALSFAELVSVTGSSAQKKVAAKTLSAQELASLKPNPPPAISIEAVLQKRSSDLCVFAMVGKCRFGSMCKNVHGLQCPRCLRYCLHPHDLAKNEEHFEECLARIVNEDPSTLSIRTEDIECGLCYQKIAHKEDPRFGLLNCEHAFCLNCIRQWRSQHTMHDLATKSCPLCRVVTFFIIPSNTWTVDYVEKQKIIDGYKKKLGEIHCKYYSSGDGVCPFGGSCFYAHKNRDGSIDRPVLRAYVDKNEQLKIIRETRLCDFIDFKVANSIQASKRQKDVVDVSASLKGNHATNKK